MFVYSQKILQFIQRVEQLIKEILSQEIGLRVHGSRFTQGRTTYPIQIVIFHHNKTLGYFDADFLEIAINESLMLAPLHQLADVIRHELAHYMIYIDHGPYVEAHGVLFRRFCQQRGWDKQVYAASTCIVEQASEETEEHPVLRKVQKLMALSSSTNKNEAEAAMIKSQQLLLKYNIENVPSQLEEEQILLKRLCKEARLSIKTKAIAKILETFFVSVVFHKARGLTCLDVSGTRVNVAIAEHVARVLDRELDALWEEAKKSGNLKGLVAKHSFLMGVARGYCKKIQAMKNNYTKDTKTTLLVVEKKLIDIQAMIYRKLSSSTSHAKHCSASSQLGEKRGRDLTIRPAVGSSPSSIQQFLIS